MRSGPWVVGKCGKEGVPFEQWMGRETVAVGNEASYTSPLVENVLREQSQRIKLTWLRATGLPKRGEEYILNAK